MGRIAIIRRFVDIDLCAGVILDLVDSGPSSTEDTSNRTSWNGELRLVVVRLLEFVSLSYIVS